MNLFRLRALLQKEWREMFKNKMVMVGVIIAPAILLTISILILILFNDAYSDLFENEEIFSQLEGEWSILFNNVLMFFMFMPLVIPLAIAVYAVVGEKEQGSLEPLLATPITDVELFLGKALASVFPGLIVTWIAFGIFSALMAGLLPMALLRLFFEPAWMLAMIGLAPLIAVFSVLAAMAISAFTRDTRAAYQLSSLIMLPFLLGSLYYVFTHRELVSVPTMFLAMAAMAALDMVMLFLGIRLFRREDILTRWQ
jgi:ABC-2 type transport system permease protein